MKPQMVQIPESYRKDIGRAVEILNYPVDLVSLDRQDAFARYLEEQGELLQIG